MVKYIFFYYLLLIVFACRDSKINKQFLNTSEMKEAKLVDIENSKALPIVIAANLTHLKNDKNTDTIPWANAYYCITALRDTVIVLDTRLLDPKVDFDEITPWAEVIKARKYKGCYINASTDEYQMIKRMKYKYADLSIILDDR